MKTRLILGAVAALGVALFSACASPTVQGATGTIGSDDRPAVEYELSDSHEQAISDGIVTEKEYRAGYERYKACMDAAGYVVYEDDTDAWLIMYHVTDESVQSGVEGNCYNVEFAKLNEGWQIANEYQSQANLRLQECLEEVGITPRSGPGDVWKQVEDAGIDPEKCLSTPPQ